MKILIFCSLCLHAHGLFLTPKKQSRRTRNRSQKPNYRNDNSGPAACRAHGPSGWFKDLQEYLARRRDVQPIDTRIGHVRPLARGRVQRVDVRVGDRVRSGRTTSPASTTSKPVNCSLNIRAHSLNYSGSNCNKLLLSASQSETGAKRLRAIAKKNAELSQVEAQSAQDSVRVRRVLLPGWSAASGDFGVEQVKVVNPRPSSVRPSLASSSKPKPLRAMSSILTGSSSRLLIYPMYGYKPRSTNKISGGSRSAIQPLSP